MHVHIDSLDKQMVMYPRQQDTRSSLPQWECKADMDSAYRFGRIQVSCEGYDNPDDPYVLRGSCGVSDNTSSGGGDIGALVNEKCS